MSNSVMDKDLVAGYVAIWSEARFDSTLTPLFDAASREIRAAVRRLCEAPIDAPAAEVDGDTVFIEFTTCHREAGAPEGALFINGRIAGFLPVQNL